MHAHVSTYVVGVGAVGMVVEVLAGVMAMAAAMAVELLVTQRCICVLYS